MASLEPIRIGVAHRGAGLAPVFSALDGGYFRAAGLEPSLVPCDGHPAALAALLDGEVDFINTVGPELILANLRTGGDVVAIASAIGRSAQQICAQPGLSVRGDLRGKRWGILARGDADDCTISMALERWGWGRDEIELVEIGHGPRLGRLLDPGRIDVAVLHAPEPFQALRRGWSIVEDLARLDVAYQNSCAATTRRRAAEAPETVRRYVEAYAAGVLRFRTDPVFGLDLLRRQTGETDSSVLVETWTLFARLMAGTTFPSLEGLRNAALSLVAVGAIAEIPDTGVMADLEPAATLEACGFFSELLGARVPANRGRAALAAI